MPEAASQTSHSWRKNGVLRCGHSQRTTMKRQPVRVVIPAVSSAGSRPAFPQDVRRAVRCTGGRYGIRGDDVRAERLAGSFRRPARFFTASALPFALSNPARKRRTIVSAIEPRRGFHEYLFFRQCLSQPSRTVTFLPPGRLRKISILHGFLKEIHDRQSSHASKLRRNRAPLI